ncbi:MAG: hypothetical protein LUC34_02250 [Campylobacter sp.]|nr:hypothetical protein [Campylobacter sp.]
MAKDKLTKSQSNQPKEINNSFHISNTYQNFNVNVIPNELSSLINLDPDFVKRYLEKEQTHRHKTEDNILDLEKNEQDIRKIELPYYRKFAFIGQILSYVTIFICLGVAGYGLYRGGISVALGSILVAAITITPQLINAYQAKKAGKEN